MLFQGAPETLVGTEGVDFYMVFHDIPCYSKALQRPLRAQREFIFILHSIIFHAIRRKVKALKKYWGGLGGVPGKVILPKMSVQEIQKTNMMQM